MESLALPTSSSLCTQWQHHWFGYYDELEFDTTNRFVFSNQVSFEHRTPRPDDVIRVGMVDCGADDKRQPARRRG